MCTQFFKQFSSHLLFFQIFSTLNKVLYNDYTPSIIVRYGEQVNRKCGAIRNGFGDTTMQLKHDVICYKSSLLYIDICCEAVQEGRPLAAQVHRLGNPG